MGGRWHSRIMWIDLFTAPAFTYMRFPICAVGCCQRGILRCQGSSGKNKCKSHLLAAPWPFLPPCHACVNAFESFSCIQFPACHHLRRFKRPLTVLFWWKCMTCCTTCKTVPNFFDNWSSHVEIIRNHMRIMMMSQNEIDLHIAGGNSLVTGGFPSHRASNLEL